MKEHPLPPVVRWLMFPTFCALAGAAGGAGFFALFLSSKGEMLAFGVLLAFLSGGAALGAALSPRLLVCLLVAPLVGVVAGGVSFYVASVAHAGNTSTTWTSVQNRLLEKLDILAILSTTVAAQMAAHAAGLRWGDGWTRPAALHLASGLLIAAAGAALASGLPDRFYLVFCCSAALQVLPLKAALAVGSRLRPAE